MSCRKSNFPAMKAQNVAKFAAIFVLLQLSGLSLAQNDTTKWKTLDGFSPLVIARGGYSGLFPDSSSDAYNIAVMTSVPDLVLWCDVQLTKDNIGICVPNIMLNNCSDVAVQYPARANNYVINGVKQSGFFSIDFTLKETEPLSLIQGMGTRPPYFDGTMYIINTVGEVFNQNNPAGFWLNIEYASFYSQHNLSMTSFVTNALKTMVITQISSPEISFLQELATPLESTETKLIFRFLDQGATEPSTNKTYGSLSKNLTFIKSFASGILVPKSYIWPVDATSYLLPHTSLVVDAHTNGLEVFASDFANDNLIAYNYSYDPVAEYLSFMDNDEFSVDGVLSDFPLTASVARECFSHVDTNASTQAKPLVISHFGASGDYPGCTDLSYTTAISDGADVIDCPVQMSSDGVPFCLSSVNLMNNTLVSQTQFRSLVTTVTEIQPSPGIFSFNLSWTDIQSLTPVLSSPFAIDNGLFRNPRNRNAGKIISLSEFLDLAKNASSLSGILINIENAKYLAGNLNMNVTDAVLDKLEKSGYNGAGAKKVMIQSTNSAVLKALKGQKYELVYEVDETIRDAPNATIADIKTFANSVVVNKESVYPANMGFLTDLTDIVPHIQSFNLPVYVKVFRNELVEIAYEFNDPIVEINSFVREAGVDGLITDFPKTATAYKRNLCLKMKTPPIYMGAVQPAQLLQLITPEQMPPAEAPNPILTDDDISEPPLPTVEDNASSPTGSTADTPKASPSGQIQITASALLSSLSIIIAFFMLL